MSNINIEETKYTPKIVVDFDARYIELSGRSYPENAFEFFEEPKVAISKMLSTKNDLQVVFDIIYVNSSSSRVFFEILTMLSEAKDLGVNIECIWKYDEDNDVALENGEDFSEEFPNLNIKIEQK